MNESMTTQAFFLKSRAQRGIHIAGTNSKVRVQFRIGIGGLKDSAFFLKIPSGARDPYCHDELEGTRAVRNWDWWAERFGFLSEIPSVARDPYCYDELEGTRAVRNWIGGLTDSSR